MQNYERLIYIVNLMQNHRDLTARVLSDKCDVSMRTIYRDILLCLRPESRFTSIMVTRF